MGSEKVLGFLRRLHRDMPCYERGEILGSMTTLPHPVAVEAYMMFIASNLGDPLVFHGPALLEKMIVEEVSSLLRGPGIGYMTSGGTESNIVAALSARELGAKTIVAPETIHASVRKAAHLLGMKLILVSVDESYAVSPEAIETALREHRDAAVFITAGTTDYGTIDDVKAVAEVAEGYGAYLHVDAAYGGLLIPFLYEKRLIDKDLRFYPGVSSISIDFHKNGLAPIPSGLILFASTELLEKTVFHVEYMPLGMQRGLLGTRPGAAAAGAWAAWKAVGRNGYAEIATRCWQLAHWLHQELVERGLGEPLLERIELPVVAFRPRGGDVERVMGELFRRKLYLYYTSGRDALRVVVMPHVEKRHLERLLRVLEEIVRLSPGYP